MLGETHEIVSAELNEHRQLNIYLPPSYHSNDTAHYPVIYLLDGGTDEDFIHVVGLVQFNSFEWIGRLPESIVVGITNTDRKRDFTFPTVLPAARKQYPTTGGSSAFISFLELELQPYIQSHFRTSQSRTLIGESLGGLLASEILISRPSLFDRYIIVSPSIWWDNGSLLRWPGILATYHPGHPTMVYIGCGKEGLAPCAEPHVMEVDANLLKDKLEAYGNKDLHVVFDYLPDENHATVAHQAIFNAIKKLWPAPGGK